MSLETVSTLLASLGGASVIVAGFAHFLGRLWADRVATQTMARYTQELEVIKSKNTLALEEFRKKSESELNDREQFSGISLEVYQGFFKSRVSCYIKLLKWKNKYISEMHENVVIEETEGWGNVYYSAYISLRSLLIQEQLYISNELEESFHTLRMEAAQYTKEADMDEGYAISAGAEFGDAYEQRSDAHDKLINKTHKLMASVLQQIDSDVTKLRLRIEIDKA